MMQVTNSIEALLNGHILLINKPFRWSSFDVIKKIKTLIKKKYNIKKIKVGHAGTLDPLATGLLLVCIGKYTKKISDLQNQQKVYTGEMTFGGSTPSYDLETPVINTFETKHITKNKIKATVNQFVGEINQTPPIFSALKKNGERLYKKARRGEKLKIPSRKVNVISFEILKIDMPKISFRITCSKGTYIRSIAHDFGIALKSGAYLSKLCRIEIGNYSLKDALDVHTFEEKLNELFS